VNERQRGGPAIAVEFCAELGSNYFLARIRRDPMTEAKIDAPSTLKAPHRLALRVYYEDTDFSGRVYHASYLRFLERGRTEWLRAEGFEQRELAAGGALVFAVRRLEIDYLKAAQMDDLLTIETAIAMVGGASIDFRQCVLRGEEKIVSALVCVAALSNGRPVRLPKEMRAKFSAQK
jgi:acyl-CoA thioester hydrolase